MQTPIDLAWWPCRNREAPPKGTIALWFIPNRRRDHRTEMRPDLTIKRAVSSRNTSRQAAAAAEQRHSENLGFLVRVLVCPLHVASPSLCPVYVRLCVSVVLCVISGRVLCPLGLSVSVCNGPWPCGLLCHSTRPVSVVLVNGRFVSVRVSVSARFAMCTARGLREVTSPSQMAAVAALRYTERSGACFLVCVGCLGGSVCFAISDFESKWHVPFAMSPPLLKWRL